MVKITIIGAGSTIFARNLIGDILSFEALREVELCLHDLDAERLAVSAAIVRRIAKGLGANPKISTTLERAEAFDGAKYVIAMFQIDDAPERTLIDFDLPRRYGLRQTMGDSIGLAGIMRGLRTIPAMLKIAADMERYCPDALLINYVDPIGMNGWAIARASKIQTIGLGHSVSHTAREIAHDLGIPREELTYTVAGIHHMAFFLTLEHEGQDLYPALHRLVAEGRIPDHRRLRYDFMRRIGYFVTESSGHLSEHVPYYIKRDRPDLIAAYNIPIDEMPRRLQEEAEKWRQLLVQVESSDAPITIDGSDEFAPEIIHSIETNTSRTVYANVPNDSLIDELPEGCVVEVPCLVDGNGVQPVRIGEMPPHLIGLIMTNVNVQRLTVEAALKQDRQSVYYAAMLDPHTSAELDLDAIWALVDDLLLAHRDVLPEFAPKLYAF